MVRRAKVLSVLCALLVFTLATAAEMPFSLEPSKEGTLRWRKTLIPVAFSNSLLRQSPALRPESDIQGAVRRSLDAWEAVADIEFQVTWTDKLSVSPAGNTGDGISLVTIAQTPENLLVFGGESAEIAARTRVFFNRRGEITESDIVLNPYQQFSTDGSIGTFDFESTLTHEIGHLLGLDHSTVAGATMNELQGKNGTFNLPSFSQRTLGEEDIAQIRGVYGAREDSDCCGSLDGKILFINPKTAKGFNVWLEETQTGRVAAGGRLNSDGSFNFKGLSAGDYRIYAHDGAGNFAGQFLGEVEIFKGRAAIFNKKLVPQSKDFDVQFTGFNGQLANLAIPVNGGKTYQIYVGGKNLSVNDFKIGSTSPFFTVSGGTVTNLDYGREISVFSFEIKSAAETPAGDYTIYFQKADGKIEFLPGSLSVERFINQWNVVTFD